MLTLAPWDERERSQDQIAADVNAAAKKVAPRAASFAALTTKQQDDTLQSIETTDAFNLQDRGVDAGVVVIQPGAVWQGTAQIEATA